MIAQRSVFPVMMTFQMPARRHPAPSLVDPARSRAPPGPRRQVHVPRAQNGGGRAAHVRESSPHPPSRPARAPTVPTRARGGRSCVLYGDPECSNCNNGFMRCFGGNLYGQVRFYNTPKAFRNEPRESRERRRIGARGARRYGRGMRRGEGWRRGGPTHACSRAPPSGAAARGADSRGGPLALLPPSPPPSLPY